MTSNGKKNPLTSLLEQVEKLVKPIAIFTGTFYVIGYVITAYRLDQYGVPTSKFIDAQYFVAGIMPGLFLWLTILIIVIAYRYVAYTKVTKADGRIRPKARTTWNIARVIFAVVVLTWVLLGTVLEDRYYELWESTYPIGGICVIVFGELSLWIFVVVLRNWRDCWREIIPVENKPTVTKWEKFNRFINSLQTGFFFVILPATFTMLFIILMFIFIVPLSWEAYMSIPQAYGGGKPLTVVLYVDDSKVPTELLDTDPKSDMSLLPCTIPLHLVYRTSTEYIVAPIIEDGEQQGWVIEASAVYALVAEINQSVEDGENEEEKMP